MLPWQDIERHPSYAGLDDAQKRQVKQRYFDDVLAPSERYTGLSGEDQERFRLSFLGGDEPAAKPPPAVAAPQQPAPRRGVVSDLATAVGRGAIGVPAMLLRAAAGADEMLDSAVGEGGGFDLKTWAREQAGGLESFRDAQLPRSQESGEGLRKALSGGVESATTSLGIKAPAAAAGAAAGFALGNVPGAVIGGVLGWLSGVPAFGLAQYDEALERYQKEGLSKGDAQVPALLEGASEAGFELFTDVIEVLTMGAGTIATAPAKAALKQGAKAVLSNSWKQALKKAAVVTGAETVGELMNVGTQAEISKHFAGTDQRFFAAIRENLGEVAVASVIFGALGGGLHMLGARQVKKALSDPNAKPELRFAAANEITEAIEKVSPDLAAQWATATSAAIQRKEAIPLDQDIAAMPIEAEIFSATPAPGAAPISGAGVEATDVGSKKAASAAEAEQHPIGAAGTETTDSSTVAAAQAAADQRGPSTPQGEQQAPRPFEGSADPDAARLTVLETALGKRNADFVANRVQELGSAEAVGKAYPGKDIVTDYANLLAKRLFGSRSDAAASTRPKRSAVSFLTGQRPPSEIAKRASEIVDAADRERSEKLRGEYARAEHFRDVRAGTAFPVSVSPAPSESFAQYQQRLADARAATEAEQAAAADYARRNPAVSAPPFQARSIQDIGAQQAEAKPATGMILPGAYELQTEGEIIDAYAEPASAPPAAVVEPSDAPLSIDERTAEVVTEVVSEKTGKPVKVAEAAGDVIDDIDARHETYLSMLECVMR